MCLHVYHLLYALLCTFQPSDVQPVQRLGATQYTFEQNNLNTNHSGNALPCLSGIINDYTPVLGFGCDSSTLQVGSLAGFAEGDKVLLLQMQVVQVDLSNTAAFGTLLNTTCIGNYEFNRIQTLGGNTVQLKYALSRPYDVSGKVQMVRVPEYDSAMVCNLTCLPWNGSVGGVLALDVKNQLSLAGNMDVSGKGFRGGIVEPDIIAWVFGEQQFFYPPESTLAAQKGEGIVFIPVDQSYGRGAAGNGGGGGNAHNGGGGGGANAGTGGQGGLEISNLPSAPTPGTNGIGGYRYFDTDPAKVLMGGGGGAGHANDAKGSSGGTGGGIIFINANILHSNNFRLLANGVDVFGGQDQNDGQGGGGGGGTLVLNIGQNNGTLNAEVTGGRGGSNPYVPDFQIHGPGGGGGGGKILLTQNIANLTNALQGGINGLTSQGLTNGATAGFNGKILNGVILQESTEPAHPVSNLMLLDAQSPSCAASMDGRIAVLHSSALAFSLNGSAWQPDSVFTNLAPGVYQISLQFSGGCTLDTMAMIEAAIPLTDTLLLQQDADCLNGGVLSISALSGIAPFEFQLNGGAWQSSGTFNQLLPGNYTINIQDAAGCSLSHTYTIASPPQAGDSLISLLNATCIEGGALDISATSGTAPFEFQLNGGAWQSSGGFNNLSPGNYSVTLRDAAGCTHSGTYFIQSPPAPADSLLALSNATCISGGEIQVGPVSGTSPFEFQLNGASWQTSGTFTTLPPGNYTVNMRDAAGCIIQKNYEIVAPPQSTLSLLALEQASCVSGGAISVEALSGTAPFEFQLDNGNWQPNAVFSDLAPGVYSIAIRDAAGCTSVESYLIEAPPPLQDSLLMLQHASCVAEGAINLQIVSGTAPFEFQLNGGSWQAVGVFDALNPGNYDISIRDGAGCTLLGNYAISAPPELRDSLLSIIHATCIEGGSIFCQAVTGSAPFEFQLNGGGWQSSGDFTNLAAGPYTVTLRDAAGCTQTDTYTIIQPPPAGDTLISLIDATCINGGALTVQSASGTAPFEFQLNGGGWQNNGIFVDLPAGFYTTSLRDAAGCTVSSNYTIQVPPLPLAQLLSLSNATCIAGGKIEVEAVSGTAPFVYQINSSNGQVNGVFSGLAAGSYSISILDAAGCKLDIVYEILPPPPAVDSLKSITNPGCNESGSVVYEAIDGTPPFQFQLDNGLWQSSGQFWDLQSGTYELTLRDAAGCIDTDNFQIAPYEPLQLALDSLGVVDCRHAEGFVAVSASGGTGEFTFFLNNDLIEQGSGYFQALPAGFYDILVSDSSGCKTVLNDLQIIDAVDSVRTQQTVIIYEGSYYQFPDGTRSARPGQYPFRYQTVEGCDSLHIIDLIVLKRHIYIPNVFSPDGDGLNDIFTVYSDASLEKVDLLRVFDRWGELVFEKQNFRPNETEKGWDGNFRGRPVNPGMFVWLVQLTFVDGLKRTLSGDITVVR